MLKAFQILSLEIDQWFTPVYFSQFTKHQHADIDEEKLFQKHISIVLYKPVVTPLLIHQSCHSVVLR